MCYNVKNISAASASIDRRHHGKEDMMYRILCSLFEVIILLTTGIDLYESICNATKVSVFNWDRDMVTVENADVFFDELSNSTISVVYQYISSKTADEDIVYYLT